MPVLRFMGFPPNAAATGDDIESMDLLAGQSVGLVHEIKPAATIVCDLVEGARQLIEQRLTPTLVGRQA
jgi:nitronate monooxygenase